MTGPAEPGRPAPVPVMSIGDLTAAITAVTSGHAAWGANLHPSKDVLLRVGPHTWPLASVSASFTAGRFVLILDAGGEIPGGLA